MGYTKKASGKRNDSRPAKRGPRTYGNRPFDDNYCFFIQDFQEGDCVIVVVEKRRRVRGRVVRVNKRSNVVHWVDANDGIRPAGMNDFCFLGEYERNWLS